MPKVEKELQCLQDQGVLEPVTHTEWATPVIPILKPNGDVRLCGDYKCTINKPLRQDPYPVPAVSQILADPAGGRHFVKLYLSQAYLQLVVDDATTKVQTIVTHKGAFKVKRLVGVSTAPSIFQRFIVTLLSSIPGVKS